MKQEKNTHVIFGTGPLGQAIMRELLNRGKQVRMVSRSGKADLPQGVELVAGDLYQPSVVRDLTRDAVVAYQCAQPNYSEWPEKFPPMQRAIVDGLSQSHTRMVAAENLYMYGDTNGQPMSEDSPSNPNTKKGKARADMSAELLAAHKAGRIEVSMVRGSDFYGPQVLGSTVGERAFSAILAGKPAEAYGNADLPRSFTYIEDFGKAMVILGEANSAQGQAWHVPNAPVTTQRQFLTTAFELAGTAPRVNVMGGFMLRIGGLFVPEAREMIEMLYQFNNPFVADDSKFKKAFGDISTPTRTALEATLAWYRDYLATQHAVKSA